MEISAMGAMGTCYFAPNIKKGTGQPVPFAF